MKPSARDVDSAVRKIGGDTEEATDVIHTIFGLIV